jgi:hypothetical protein
MLLRRSYISYWADEKDVEEGMRRPSDSWKYAVRPGLYPMMYSLYPPLGNTAPVPVYLQSPVIVRGALGAGDLSHPEGHILSLSRIALKRKGRQASC